MNEKSNITMIYTTCPSLQVAELIAGTLIKRRLAACVNIIPKIISIYSWDSKIKRDHEVAMLVKTKAKVSVEATAIIRELHTYDMPAIVTLSAEGGCETFLQWVQLQTGI
ncbi:MAG: Divalent-cation tolerance protein CutA [Hyphomicrobiaceae bacterium hypho_1]